MKKFFLFLIISSSWAIACNQTVVFNYCGVLVGKADEQAIANFIQESLLLSDTELEGYYIAKHEKVKSGKTTDEKFWIGVAQEKQIFLPENWGQTFNTKKQQSIHVNEDVYVIVEQLKKNNIQVVLISNVDTWRASLIPELGLYNPFDLCVLACDISVKQPSLEAYQILLSILRQSPDEVIVIYDQSKNTEHAKLLGIDTVIFTSSQQLEQELIKRGLLQPVKMLGSTDE